MSFINNGFVIYKNCINKDLIKELKKSFLADLKEITKVETDNINSIDKLFLKIIQKQFLILEFDLLLIPCIDF